jgi:pimeloyl-ACP methyl ester carboxylesterase
MSNSKTILVAAMFISWAGVCAGQSAPARLLPHHANTARAGDPRLVLESCQPPGVEGEARCGSYEVFENRAAKSGRTIKLRIVILKALSKTPAPDPIFFLHGGPGAAASDALALGQRGPLAPSRQERDLVFVDQRGTGGSNPLLCNLEDNPEDMQDFFGQLFPRDKVRECRQKLEKVADLTLYTTPIAVDDLDEVRSALGYGKINLFGASYGTLAAQIYMRRHPESVRSVVLIGVATPNIKQPLLFPRSAQQAMDLLFADCAADELCRKAFPDLQQEFKAVLDRFAKGPLTVELVNPANKKREQVRLPRSNFVERIRLAMYNTGSQRFMPFIIHRAFLNDYIPWEEAAVRFSPGAAVARGMYLTVTCSEGTRFITDKDLVEETRATFVGEERVRRHMEACQEWPRGEIPPSYIDLVKSDLPVLMISGEADGSSPLWFGESAVRLLPNGRQVKIRYYGHQMDGPCVQSIFQKFISAGSSKDLDTGCTESIRRPPFATEMPKEFALE